MILAAPIGMMGIGNECLDMERPLIRSRRREMIQPVFMAQYMVAI